MSKQDLGTVNDNFITVHNKRPQTQLYVLWRNVHSRWDTWMLGDLLQPAFQKRKSSQLMITG